jgi:diguanylate cyclase (GGDEF)-like protein
MALALGAPIGWLLIRWFEGHSPLDEIGAHPDLYLYLLVGTACAFGAFGAAIGWHEDKLENANRDLMRLSLTDDLTGLRNARYFRIRLREELARAVRQKEPIAVAIIDLDHFKMVNDRYGHPVGDELLARIGDALDAATRRGETSARVGGEEFAFLLPGSDGRSAARAAERMRKAIASVVLKGDDGEEISVTASAGVASTAENEVDDDTALYARADEALYQAKQRGRDRVEIAGREEAA